MQRIARGKAARKEVQAKKAEQSLKNATEPELDSSAPDAHSVTIAEPAVSSVHLITPVNTLDTVTASEVSGEASTSTGSSTVTVERVDEDAAVRSLFTYFLFSYYCSSLLIVFIPSFCIGVKHSSADLGGLPGRRGAG